MLFLDCCANPFASISRAAAKSFASKLRSVGIGSVARDWPRRATICETCHLRVVVRGISYCGRPFTQHIDRDPILHGCGCPTRAKAQSPNEHCPLTVRNQPALQHNDGCDCKWCAS